MVSLCVTFTVLTSSSCRSSLTWEMCCSRAPAPRVPTLMKAPNPTPSWRLRRFLESLLSFPRSCSQQCRISCRYVPGVPRRQLSPPSPSGKHRRCSYHLVRFTATCWSDLLPMIIAPSHTLIAPCQRAARKLCLESPLRCCQLPVRATTRLLAQRLAWRP